MGSYLSTAYSSKSLEHQRALGSRSWFKRWSGRRLPWGNTQPLVPEIFMTPGPDAMRVVEQQKLEKEEKLAKGTYKSAPFEHVDFHDRCDHEHYRHAPWSARTRFWIYVATFGKGGFFIFLFTGTVVALLDGFDSNTSFIRDFWDSLQFFTIYTLLPCALVWGIASLVIHRFPRLWAKPGKGPKWELNRRTGMITVF